MKNMYECSQERMEEKITAFQGFGLNEDGSLTRYALSEEEALLREEFISWMSAIGAFIETDDMANMYATLPGSDPQAKRIVMGSHIDSVKNGGHYDGILGVISGMEVLETVYREKISHSHPFTVMIWTNEEGSLFPPAIMSSGVITGKFSKEAMLESKSIIDEEFTFGHALQKSKYRGAMENRLNPEKYELMLELHVEQGPVLEEGEQDIGVVTCVLGMVNYRIRTYGQANHAGTTPMKHRKDALYAAARIIQYLHDELDKLDDRLVYTTGEIKCHPCIHTVIPDYVDFSLDVRHEEEAVLKRAAEIIESIPDEIAGCRTEKVKAWSRNTVYFDKRLVKYVKDSADELNYSNMYINSGAGHDAQYAADMLPTTMIFVPSEKGYSHCREEFTPLEQCTKGASVMLNAVIHIDRDGITD